MTTKKKRPTKEELFDLFITKNHTKQEIADMYGVNLECIKTLTKKYHMRKKDYRDTIEDKPNPEKIDLKAEADKIADQMLQSKGITHNEETPVEDTTSKVDEFLKSLEEDASETDIPLEWQPTMNVVTRMYETGEERYNNVKFYRAKGIIVNLPKKNYNNPERELSKMKFNIGSDAFNYDLQEDNEKSVITISLK